LVESLESRMLLTSVVVNTVVDALYPPGSGVVSLRNAIAVANSSATPTTITFSPTVFPSAMTIVLNGTPLVLANTSEAITIVGPASGVTLDAQGKNSVLGINGGVNATISGITATHGSGGAVDNNGSLVLNNATISNSSTTPNGGGMINNGTATLTNVTVSGNKAYFGGGIINNGTITLTNSTLSGNPATGLPQIYGAAGAGIYNNGNATLVNVTASGNTAAGGGGVYSYKGNVSLTNCTVAGNVGGSGILNTGIGMFTIVNSIAADNNPGAEDADGPFNSLGYNIIGKADQSSGWNILDFTGTIAHPLNPALGTLGNNGGPTQTMVPLPGSPAIDAGSNAWAVDASYNPLPTDQRGYPRIHNATVDIGAVEVQPVAVAPTLLGTQIDDGNRQRSVVRSLKFTFSSAVTLSAGAITLAQLNTGGSGINDGSASTDASAALGTPTTSDGGLTWVVPILHSTPFSDASGSLTDGIYATTVHATLATDAYGQHLTGGDQTKTFHRLFGDINGDKRVNASDYQQFAAAFGSDTMTANYNTYFDFNHDGRINATDYQQLTSRFGKSFVYTG
jgi:hypothetical protein